ncbi:MAG: hypothetical protein V1855_00030 [bacterium]
MTNKDKIIQWINNGKQIGKIFSFKINGKIIWSSVGIQKWQNVYKVYVDEIEEKNITSENYLRNEIKKFDKLSDALNFIDKNTKINSNDLEPCKGQKIFNPKFE